MKKKILLGSIASLFAIATVFNMGLLNFNKQSDATLEAITVMIKAQNESNNLWIRYLNNEEPCTITEVRECKVEIYIPFYGYCSLGFDYTVNVDGTMNPCLYTGNKKNTCNYYMCTRNM